MAKGASPFTWSSYFARLAAALALVLVTYNPSGYSFFHWIKPVFRDPQLFVVAMALAAIVLLIGWVIFLRFTSESLGFGGSLLVAAFFVVLYWAFYAWGWLTLDSWSVVAWLILVALAGLLSVGTSWSHIRKRMSGQVDVVDEHDGV
jgi:hypothetical protein